MFDWGAQYVHPDGADTNSGFDPSEPKATIEAAVGDLGSDGGTVVLASKQRHDVGAGLVLDRQANVSFRGIGRAKRDRNSSTQPSNPLIYSSTGAATLVDLTTPNSSINSYGWEWVDIDFEVSPTTTRVIEAPNVNMSRVQSCGFYHGSDDEVEAPFQVIHAFNLTAATGDDSSWWRVSDNYVRGGQLLHATGHGMNQWVIRENIVFPINQVEPCIYMEGGHRHVIRDNNLEGANTSAGIYLKDITTSRLDGNAGERTDPFIVLEKCYGNLISDFGIVAPGPKNATLIKLISGSNNVIICSVVTGSYNLYNNNWLDDQTGGASNWIIAPSTNKDRVKISLPGLIIQSGEFINTVLGKAGDVGIRNSQVDPPFFYYKINSSFDGSAVGWRKIGVDVPDSAGTGFRGLRVPNA